MVVASYCVHGIPETDGYGDGCAYCVERRERLAALGVAPSPPPPPLPPKPAPKPRPEPVVEPTPLEVPPGGSPPLRLEARLKAPLGRVEREAAAAARAAGKNFTPHADARRINVTCGCGRAFSWAPAFASHQKTCHKFVAAVRTEVVRAEPGHLLLRSVPFAAPKAAVPDLGPFTGVKADPAGSGKLVVDEAAPAPIWSRLDELVGELAAIDRRFSAVSRSLGAIADELRRSKA